MEILLVDIGLIICCCSILFKTPDSSLGHRLTVGRRRTPPSLAAVFVHVRGGGPVAGEVGGPMVEGRADLEGAADPGIVCTSEYVWQLDRIQLENCCEVSVFSKLTNASCYWRVGKFLQVCSSKFFFFICCLCGVLM